MNGKSFPFLFFIGLLLSTSLLLPAQEQLTIGGEEGWSRLSKKLLVSFEEGRGGYRDLRLAERSYRVEEGVTDLLLHFDGRPFTDSSGHYEVEADSRVTFVQSGRIGPGAAKFTRRDGGLTLKPKNDVRGALFGEDLVSGSFSFEFWLYPLHLEEGETILLWEGQNFLGGRLHLQAIRASIDKRVLSWDFSRIFFSSDFRPRSIKISGTKKLIPREWHHHLIRYNARTGLIEYLLDGKPEAIAHITDTGGEKGTVQLPYVGKSSDRYLSIGEEFDGKIDELRFSRSVVQDPLLHSYSNTKGVAETELIDLGSYGSTLQPFGVEQKRPPETDIFLFYRIYETMEEAITDSPRWIPFRPGEELNGEREGRYLELRMELLPDGPGTTSPSLSSITVSYEPNPPPLAPAYVKAEPGNGEVSVSWNPTMEEDLAGYLLYYGTRPGEYRGADASTVVSPIDVGKTNEFVVEGLENERVYYFAVASYDSAGKKNRSPLSEEVSARPTPYAEEE